MLSLALKGLAMKYVLVPMVLVPEILQDPEGYELRVPGIRDQHCTAGLGIAMTEG